MIAQRSALAICLLVLTGLTACDDDVEAPRDEVVRAIKHMTLGDRAGQQERRIAGVVAASLSTNIAFETSGQIVEVLRDPGDAVTEGDLVARLDPEPYQLRVTEAQNNLAQAQASLDDAQKKFEQQRRLRQQGFATQTAFDSAEATLRSAEGAVGVSQTQVEIANRDLAKTDLRAPFDGVVARRLVDVFEEVTGGTAIYAIQTASDDKVEASLPETLVNTISLGAEVEVSFPPLGGASVMGTLDEISPQSGDGNSFPIKVVLENTPPGLRAGMSAELIFRFASAATGTAFSVPIAAILPNPAGDEDAAVFVYDPGTQTLVKRQVTVVNVIDNQLQIVGNLASGEVIATAGVSFLHDGMRVDLFDTDAFR